MKSSKKGIKILLSLCLIVPLLFSSFGPITKANAACYPTYMCSDNNVHSVHNVSVYYTKSEVKKIISRYNALGSNQFLIISYIIGLKSPQAGLGILMYTLGANNGIAPFKKAYSQNTGLQIKYTVTVYKGSNATTKVSNVKYYYK
ncbi:hypothetical protein APP_30930 [Aeribacillus pallidus]|nr:hypothetical protein APP_30930 [Aeribacillus pallidus]